ncbi:MAG: MBL fold metallo-hydrolase [Thermotogota bacterium]
MKKATKIILITCFVIVGVVIIGKLIFDHVITSDYMISRGIEQRNKRNDEVKENFLNKDNITVVLVGTAGPMSPDIAQNSTAVFVNGQFLLFDAGDYAQKRMEQFNLPGESLDAVFLTHFHNDHIADLGEVMQRSYMLGREKDLVVYGPTGVEDIVAGFNMIYTFDSDYRTVHHGEEVMPLEYQFATAQEFDSELKEVVVYEKDGVVVTAFQNSHPPIEPTFGYVIEYDGRKVVISGDTLVTDDLTRLSKDADLLVMDIMNYELVTLMEETFRKIGDDQVATIMYDIREYHPDVADVASMAEKQNVKRMALTHYAPAAPNQTMMDRFYVNPIKEKYHGQLIAGSDGTTVVIPLTD